MSIFTLMTGMGSKLIISCIATILLIGVNNTASAQNTSRCDLICGKWMTTGKDLTVEIYKDGGQFKARILWFDDSDDKTRPMETRLDTDNPDAALRTQKVLGSSVLQSLVYEPDTDSWEKGIIYDAKHGRNWDSSAYITPDGLLKVTGYWHFKFIGKTLTFTRV